ncbi:MAG: UvrD-helicase domain-containing protein, partial [Lentisphaeria bacterium]|nr:UvrD-helicase domain-containing protein [Lentisphaeria bacterium]
MSENVNNTGMHELNSYTCELAGSNMISAGAGTGKTYNIQILVLREILMGTPIEKILVVTFTELATQELQDRIRRILQNALRICDCLVKHGAFTRDALKNFDDGAAILADKTLEQALPCFGLVDDPAKTLPPNERPKSLDDIAEKKRLLENAVRNFDDAPISTIHGFCNRMLKENTFESGIRYGLELRNSCKALVKSLLCDFYRDFCHKSNNARRFLLLKLLKYTPSGIIADRKELLGNADARINWGDDIPETVCADALSGSAELKAIEDAPIWERFPRALQKVSDEELDAFCLETKFKKDTAVFFREIGDDRWLLYAYDELENKVKTKDKPSSKKVVSENMSQEAQELHAAYLEAFAPAQLQTQEAETKKLPEGSIPWLLDKYRRIILQLAAAYVKKELANAKETEGFMTFEDLLIVLKNRVECANGEEFRKIIRDRFDCVMIDEFQDTDHTQSTIFKRLFAGNDDESQKRLLIMIGDEKQAIYKFRGGDVQTFQKMTGTAKNKYTLKKNFRSTRDFINAMNDFWLNKCEGKFFAPAEIKFEKIEVGTGSDKCLVDKRDGRIPSGQTLLSRNHQEDKSVVFQELAKEILELKNNYCKATQKDDGANEYEPIKFKDIAILVRTKTNVDEIRRILHSNDIPSVFMQSQSVFKTDECKWMLDFIDAILDPGNQSKALRMLSCGLFGFSASQIECINERYLANLQSFLKEMNALWHRKSFF